MTPLFRLGDPSFLMPLGYHYFLGLLNIYQFLITRIIIEREKKGVYSGYLDQIYIKSMFPFNDVKHL